ncbi:MAG: peroxiredoxin [Deltaproteobacteria bacterium]|nr:peroxiredoxin [Deltaproteobacteria bacterium]HCH65267.1 peroxiredoxin [Deltaproteobacteria bacterium]|tara:strand:- start:227 stop:697 length:471 start_codon:yes stop_codon:yes gene_type:complete
MTAVGDTLPKGTLFPSKEGQSTTELFGTGKHVLIGVIGAFTGTCTNDHMPTYLNDFERWDAAGYTLSVVATSDPFVMDNWRTVLGAGDKIRFLADPTGAYAVTLGINIDGIPFFGTTRFSRFAMTIEDGVITNFDVEPDKFGVSCSLSGPLLEKIG